MLFLVHYIAGEFVDQKLIYFDLKGICCGGKAIGMVEGKVTYGPQVDKNIIVVLVEKHSEI